MRPRVKRLVVVTSLLLVVAAIAVTIYFIPGKYEEPDITMDLRHEVDPLNTYADSLVHMALDVRLTREKQLETLEKAKDAPLSYMNKEMIARAYFNMRMFPEAIEYYEQCINLNPDSTSFIYNYTRVLHYTNLAVCHLWQRNPIRAAYYLKRAEQQLYSLELPTEYKEALLTVYLRGRYHMLRSRLYTQFWPGRVDDARLSSDSVPQLVFPFKQYDTESWINYYMNQGDSIQAYENLDVLLDNYKRYYSEFLVASPFSSTGFVVSDQNLEKELTEYDYLGGQMQTLCSRYRIPAQDSLLYDYLLFTKNLVLSTHKYLTVDNQRVSGALAQILIKHTYREAMAEPDYWKRNDLFNTIDRVQRIMYETLTPDQAKCINGVSLDSVRRSLKSGEVAIEFGSFRPINDFEFSNEVLYYALVLRNDMKYPAYVPLFAEKDIDKNNYNWKVSGRLIANALWEPLMPYLSTTKTIYFSPSGVLHTIPVEHLPMASGESMSDAYNMRRVSSTSYVTIAQTLSAPTVAYLFGGLEYQSNRTLSESEQEVEDIASILEGSGVKVYKYTGKYGTDIALQDIIDSHNKIIHLATHAFSYSLADARVSPYYKNAPYLLDLQDPMLRYGIVMAKDETLGALNGLVTASELVNCDFTDCDLLVLSACGSGLGDVQTEGVYGLGRACRMAGAKTVVMSMWDVDDTASRIFMEQFYAAMAAGEDKYSAFNSARKQIKALPQYSNPLFWASFVMLD